MNRWSHALIAAAETVGHTVIGIAPKNKVTILSPPASCIERDASVLEDRLRCFTCQEET